MSEKPPTNEAKRCIEIRTRSKRGEFIASEDRDFCERMWDDYQEWYEGTQRQIFVESAPFGSQIKEAPDA